MGSRARGIVKSELDVQLASPLALLSGGSKALIGNGLKIAVLIK